MIALAYIAGFIAVGFIAVGVLVTPFGFSGSAGESYSPLNHWISDLLKAAYSRWVWLIRICFMVGGIAFGVHMIGVATKIPDSGTAWAFAIIGALSGIFGMLVGVFPEGKVHGGVALGFFALGTVDLALFGVHVLNTATSFYPKWFAIPSFLMVASFVTLGIGSIVEFVRSGFRDVDFPPPDQRAAVLLIPTTEWLSLILLLLWVAIVSFFLVGK